MPDAVRTPHARVEPARRDLPEEIVRAVLEAPEQRAEARPGRVVLQSRVTMGSPGRRYLVRVVVDVQRRPPEVVTVYRTSRIAKYWRDE
ncbi:MAG: DUF4258 domain-containing protein [Candidatus Rokubacteria bacterium]|nr:DUF4258 domain-containing protein [Candidatus Rokubacteria bacterium]